MTGCPNTCRNLLCRTTLRKDMSAGRRGLDQPSPTPTTPIPPRGCVKGGGEDATRGLVIVTLWAFSFSSYRMGSQGQTLAATPLRWHLGGGGKCTDPRPTLLSGEGLCGTLPRPLPDSGMCGGSGRCQSRASSSEGPSRLQAGSFLPRIWKLADGSDSHERQERTPLWSRTRPQFRAPGNVQCLQECAGSCREPQAGPGGLAGLGGGEGGGRDAAPGRRASQGAFGAGSKVNQEGTGWVATGSGDRGWGAAEGKGSSDSRPPPQPPAAPPPQPSRVPRPRPQSRPAALTGDAGDCGTGLGRLRIPASGKQEAGIRK